MNAVIIFLVFCKYLIVRSLSDVPQEDVKFVFSKQDSTQEMRIGEYGKIKFDLEEEVKIYCHGWVDSLKSNRFFSLKAEYLKRGFENIIGVDWSEQAKGFYSHSVDLIEEVGYHLALFIIDLRNGYNISMSKIHLIGHSLGAHVCGYAGQYVRSLEKEVIGRITGLDPAGPRFETALPHKRLSTGDAIFVDIIHTDGGVLGCKTSLGDVDFFPNGGVGWQVGCGVYEISCSHNRAPAYFIESINSKKFIGVHCDSYAHFQAHRCDDNNRIVMGENTDRSARGSFYLKTNHASPFALG